MNKKTFLLVVSMSFLGWFASNASVTSVGDSGWTGGIYCYEPVLQTDSNGQSALMSGNQWLSSGSMDINIAASSTTDPILSIGSSINNTSSFAWTEYIVTLSMNQAFSINSANVSAPLGWSANITGPGGPDISGNYIGTIDYLAGTPVAVSGTLDFNYVVQFTGSLSYSLTESVQAVPEPGVFSLLTSGALLLGGLMMAKRRQAKLLRVKA
jgi:hypothetical protein